MKKNDGERKEDRREAQLVPDLEREKGKKQRKSKAKLEAPGQSFLSYGKYQYSSHGLHWLPNIRYNNSAEMAFHYDAYRERERDLVVRSGSAPENSAGLWRRCYCHRCRY